MKPSMLKTHWLQMDLIQTISLLHPNDYTSKHICCYPLSSLFTFSLSPTALLSVLHPSFIALSRQLPPEATIAIATHCQHPQRPPTTRHHCHRYTTPTQLAARPATPQPKPCEAQPHPSKSQIIHVVSNRGWLFVTWAIRACLLCCNGSPQVPEWHHPAYGVTPLGLLAFYSVQAD